MKIDYFKLVVSILLCQLAGIVGSFFTASSVSTWYLTLNKPFFTPPSGVFGPVWISLYLLMGIALYLVWNKKAKKKQKRLALGIFAGQLTLNALWSILFFGLQSPFLAFVGIIALWILILLTIIYFWRISKTAAFLLLPYILWVSFAAILNYFLMVLN